MGFLLKINDDIIVAIIWHKTFCNMKQPNMAIPLYNTFHEVGIFENQIDRK
jgi:hypothetical protein